MEMQMPLNMQIDSESTIKQFREFLTQYNRISEQCFADCVHDFTTRKILEPENTCSLNCLEKFLKMSQRVSQRFQEHHLTLSDSMAATAQAQSMKK
ncbi:hypothetical protein C0Q70_13153 [Pomacea canaliculata]|uniref:Mitochondrial import inner membrane translocase subunit n=1 Tax=Pomacea canaliculata TaxID=400727 RepID=A0A2T7NWG5_POMCA|nr:mitochondrial import inner membrane translocase subunit Tim9-like [Pomacea canaliculata]XP_025105339.1 mitochondrial import inner membrane translocase subunit Tim9-like [Pomacea canaliculata]XP_025105340.1 mitochondrial import inner membrane translocase subunit Tim9-like [Pomacea canaliculata]XP_025105341.1 mitochondrial import inner membrane translocase subunit Tim9-like [Pomacea canaliculata]PVD25497.1 hypothetical protein C0Q70_13153 [Pomacea canaliculata]